jgi:ribonuclease D
MASTRDIAPGRVLPDAAIVDAARKNPKSVSELVALPIFGGSRQRRNGARWFEALRSSAELADDQLPPVTGTSVDALPPNGRWRERSPEAAARLAVAREVIATIAAEHHVLAQNLLASDALRRLAWSPPPVITLDSVTAQLAGHGARRWQLELTAEPLTAALLAPPAEPAANVAPPQQAGDPAA